MCKREVSPAFFYTMHDKDYVVLERCKYIIIYFLLLVFCI